jgi:hypothetical protein
MQQIGGPGASTTFFHKADLTTNTVRIGVDYKLAQLGPPVRQLVL